jgi:CHASE2 domain-containing sensor protein
VGLLALALTLKARRHAALPVGTLLGFLITGLAAISLSLFLVVWDLGP